MVPLNFCKVVVSSVELRWSLVSVLDTISGTAFAYGQTSSGKIFTMNGSDADPGIIRLAVRDVFEKINTVMPI